MAIDFPAGPSLNELYTDSTSGNVYKCIQVSPTIVWSFGTGTTSPGDPGVVTDLTGSIAYFAYDGTGAVPSGYLPANGATLSTYDYRALHSRISNLYGGVAYQPGITDQPSSSTTFNLPDLRGEFIRGWDSARGLDSGRVMGSVQLDQNLSHTHSGSTADPHNHTQSVVYTADGTGNPGPYSGAQYAASRKDQLYIDQTQDAVVTLTLQADGGSELRPRNIALFACIHY